MLTHELRWFGEGPVEERALRAFAGARRLERRADDYLLATGEGRGIKRRGRKGGLEDKRRRAQRPVRIGLGEGALAGVIESWHKSWPGQLELPGNTWIRVDKLRASARVGGCRAELTSLVVSGASHFSVALETKEAAPEARLVAAAGELLRAQPGVLARLEGAHSCGYPGWLARLAADQAEAGAQTASSLPLGSAK